MKCITYHSEQSDVLNSCFGVKSQSHGGGGEIERFQNNFKSLCGCKLGPKSSLNMQKTGQSLLSSSLERGRSPFRGPMPEVFAAGEKLGELD